MRRCPDALVLLILLVLALPPLAGCGARAAATAPNSDGGPAHAAFRSACAGPSPRAQLNGMEVQLGSVQGTRVHSWDCKHCPPDSLRVSFPLEDYPLAEELLVTVGAPRVSDVDLARLPEGMFIEVTGKPFPSVAVQDTTIFSTVAGQPARGSLHLSEAGVLSFCLDFDRRTDWFHPDHVVLFLPDLILQ